MNDFWKDYFAFNKRQRNGILVLVALISLMLIYLFISDYFPSSQKQDDFSSFNSELKSIPAKSYQPLAISHQPSLIDINSADTSLLLTLPDMTSYCAAMIVKYRKKLGGYYSVKQLKEVWAMDSLMYAEALTKVMADTTLLHKININEADSRKLAYHPYIHSRLAKVIVNYKDQHGLYKSVKDLHGIIAVNDSIYARISPYLTVGER